MSIHFTPSNIANLTILDSSEKTPSGKVQCQMALRDGTVRSLYLSREEALSFIDSKIQAATTKALEAQSASAESKKEAVTAPSTGGVKRKRQQTKPQAEKDIPFIERIFKENPNIGMITLEVEGLRRDFISRYPDSWQLTTFDLNKKRLSSKIIPLVLPAHEFDDFISLFSQQNNSLRGYTGYQCSHYEARYDEYEITITRPNISHSSKQKSGWRYKFIK